MTTLRPRLRVFLRLVSWLVLLLPPICGQEETRSFLAPLPPPPRPFDRVYWIRDEDAGVGESMLRVIDLGVSPRLFAKGPAEEGAILPPHVLHHRAEDERTRAALASHVNLWIELASAKEGLYVVVTGDVRFSDDFDEQLRCARKRLPENWTFLALGGSDRRVEEDDEADRLEEDARRLAARIPPRTSSCRIVSTASSFSSSPLLRPGSTAYAVAGGKRMWTLLRSVSVLRNVTTFDDMMTRISISTHRLIPRIETDDVRGVIVRRIIGRHVRNIGPVRSLAFANVAIDSSSSSLSSVWPRISSSLAETEEEEEKDNVVILVLSAQENRHRRDAIRASWMIRGSVYFVVGRDPDSDALREESFLHSDMVFVDMARDTYEMLPEKLKLGLRWAIARTNTSWIMKSDDDSVVRVSALRLMLSSLDATRPVVVGCIRRDVRVPRDEQSIYNERVFPRDVYPTFPNGAHGYVISRNLVRAIVRRDDDDTLMRYAGEDVSIGIWSSEIDDKPLFVHSRRFTVDLTGCDVEGMVSIGQVKDVTTLRTRCALSSRTAMPPSPPPLLHRLHGGLGNRLFQFASINSIAASRSLDACFSLLETHDAVQRRGQVSLVDLFEDLEDVERTGKACERGIVLVAHERGYARYDPHIDIVENDAERGESRFGYFQSYKYFDHNARTLRATLRFKSSLLKRVSLSSSSSDDVVRVGVHVRRGDLLRYGYVRFPGREYFENAMAHFRDTYRSVLFLVVSDDMEWCKQQSIFRGDDVALVGSDDGAVDFVRLATCDHLVLTVGTFGWWAAYLGAGAKGGEVVYYDSEFKMEHPTNKGNVVFEDYYPAGWTAMGRSAISATRSFCSPGILYLDGYATREPYRKFASLLFPEMEQRDYAQTPASETTENDVLFIGIAKYRGDVAHFKGKILHLEGESSYPHDIPNEDFFLGPILQTHNPHHRQLFYAQFGAAVAGLHRLTGPRRRHDATKFLTYRSGHCVSYREKAFRRICEHMERVPGAICHATKCAGGYTKAIVKPTPGYWVNNSDESPYRFELSMENTKMDGYVTEKIVNAFLSGAIPIFYGTTDVFKLFNKDAFIYYDIDDPQPALHRILYLETNRTAYAEVLAQPILADGALEEYFSLSDDVGRGKLKRRIRDMVLGQGRGTPTTNTAIGGHLVSHEPTNQPKVC